MQKTPNPKTRDTEERQSRWGKNYIKEKKKFQNQNRFYIESMQAQLNDLKKKNTNYAKVYYHNTNYRTLDYRY